MVPLKIMVRRTRTDTVEMRDSGVATQKFDLSLRLRHPDADLNPIARKLGLAPSTCWTKGDARVAPDGAPLGGVRDSSYCSVQLDVTAGTDLEAALVKSL